MSFSLYWCPLPKIRPEPKSGYALKWAIARQFGEHDGSCREGPFTFDASVIPWLEGVRDAHGVDRHGRKDELTTEAEELIKCIRDNPQGVQVWIGDSDDAGHQW